MGRKAEHHRCNVLGSRKVHAQIAGPAGQGFRIHFEIAGLPNFLCDPSGFYFRPDVQVFGFDFVLLVRSNDRLFDSLDALNPIAITTSIAKTFLPYCRLLLILALLVCIGVGISAVLGYISCPQFLTGGVGLYLLLIKAHLLGRFYWRYKHKLDWGI